MRSPFRIAARYWLLVPFCGCGFLLWVNGARMERAAFVTKTDSEQAVVDAASPTGYAGGKRWLIVPGHNNRSYEWIAGTQQMLARHEWRVRHVDYENAPFGREVHAPSPYRWWLGLLAWCDHAVSDRPLGLSVERAALWADPIVQLLLLAATAVFVGRCFGGFSAAMLSAGLVAVYPFASAFLPGAPDDHGLALALSLWSVLLVLAGLRVSASPDPRESSGSGGVAPAGGARRTRRLFFSAGIAGGLALWINAVNQAPVIVGLALGGTLAAWISRQDRDAGRDGRREIAPWGTWAFGGAITCLAAYLIEYFPSHLDFRLEVNHPLYGLAWLGLGEIMTQAGAWLSRGNAHGNLRSRVRLALAAGAMAALPVALKLTRTPSLLGLDQYASHLSLLPGAPIANNLAEWLRRDDLSAPVWAALLPVGLVGAAVWLLARHKSCRRLDTGIALTLGPIAVTLLLACHQLRWWNLCDCMLLALLTTLTAATTGRARWWWSGFAALIFAPGIFQLIPPAAKPGAIAFTRTEVESLLERELAHWIADHADAGGAVVLAPPDRTTSWCFHGGFRGVGTGSWENRDGLAATVRIVTSTTAAEALALISERGITHIVLPSWDSDLDEFARWSLSNPNDAFIMAIHHWELPPWLQPRPYQLPAVQGFASQSVVILKVTAETNRVAAISRLAEYFLETQQPAMAAKVSLVLRRYPTDLGALVALAQFEKASGDVDGFARTFADLLSSLAARSDRGLAWDRRVSLAVVLALGQRNDLAREQIQVCLAKMDETRLRSLTTGALFRLELLARAFGMDISDQRLRELALRLLPSELRARL